jgi:hypothetical protein
MTKPTTKPNVFISYSRKDETSVHFLAHILRRQGINCAIDRELPIGKSFDNELQQKIKDPGVVLVYLTKAAVESPWVNQEIGFAIAHGKRVFPLAMQSDIQPHGMLQMMHGYPLFDWARPDEAIKSLVKALHATARGAPGLHKQLGLDRLLEGREARSCFVTARLRELAKQTTGPIEVLHQAAFSIFSASDDPLYYDAPGHTPELVKLHLEEKAALEALVLRSNCSFKMILWPVRAYEPRYLGVRYASLLEWLERAKNKSTIDFVCAHYAGPNRLIVKGEFLIEGFKAHGRPGYDMTLVKYRRERIDQAASEFNTTFARAAASKESAIERLRQWYEQTKQLTVGGSGEDSQ